MKEIYFVNGYLEKGYCFELRMYYVTDLTTGETTMSTNADIVQRKVDKLMGGNYGN